MEALTLARWQFGVTTVYHFILVPLTIGLAPLVAIMQTLAYRAKDDESRQRWERLTNFFGKILLINFALGVATGIVQEFQFGMNWSRYAEMVGDIFGAPLAFEALLAFFLESTFLGLWIFGKGRMPAKIHLMCIWLAAIGVNISAFFILAANSFMQHPVGAKYDEETGRAVLDGVGGFIQVLTQKTSLATFGHTVTSSFLVAGLLILGVSMWWIVRNSNRHNDLESNQYWKPAAKFGIRTSLIAGILVIFTGHIQGQIMYEIQPMKMAAAEVTCEKHEGGVPLSILAIGNLDNGCENIKHLIELPGVTSFMATNSFDTPLPDVDTLNEQMKKDYGADTDYRPNMMITYWTFRAMIFTGLASIAFAIWSWLKIKGDRLPSSRKFGTFALWMIPIPFVGASFGWIFTEIGRQPWVVAPNPAALGTEAEKVRMLTEFGVSSDQVVSAFSVGLTLVIFTLLYAALGVVWFILLKRYVREGLQLDKPTAIAADDSESETMSFAY